MNCPTHPNVKLICPACNGAHTSEAKKKASRENGKKGGWPKGKPRKDTPIFHIYQMPRGDLAFSGNGVVSDGYESIAVAVEAARKVREDAFCKIFEQRKIKAIRTPVLIEVVSPDPGA